MTATLPTTEAVSPETPRRPNLIAGRDALTGQVRIMTRADAQAFESFCAAFTANLAPGPFFELQLARSAAENQWRLNRARAIEDTIMSLEIARGEDDEMAGGHRQAADAIHQARSFAQDSKTFQHLALYEYRLRRAVAQDLRLFHEMKDARLAAEARTLEEATLLRQLALRQNLEFDPESESKANGGSVYTNDYLDQTFARACRLAEAAKLAPVIPFRRPAGREGLFRTRAA